MKDIIIVTIFFATIFSSCKKTDTIDNPTSDTKGVYVAGYSKAFSGGSTGKFVAKYWKNGVAVSLTDGTNNAEATCIVVIGNDVYVAGTEYNSSFIAVAKYWKNGIGISLTDGTKPAYAKSIAIVGSDVYVAGEENTSADNNIYTTVAKYWKNGTAINLTSGSTMAYAQSIFINGSDIYVAGSETNGSSASSISIAKYWKNGNPISIGNITTGGSANCIAVEGNDVYVAGSEVYNTTLSRTLAKCWKNGIALPLEGITADNTTSSIINSLVLKGTDVYTTGFIQSVTGASINNSRTWKNGVVTYILSGDLSKGNSIFVSGSDVYTAGTTYELSGGGRHYVARYWKNGVSVAISDNTKEEGWANSIYVTN